MDSISINSLKGYSKVDDHHHHHLPPYFIRRTNNKISQLRKRSLIFVVLSAILLAAVIIIVAVAAAGALNIIHKNNTKYTGAKTPSSSSSSAAADDHDSSMIEAVCSVTHYPNSCITSLLQQQDVSSSSGGGGGGGVDHVEGIFRLSLSIALKELSTLSTIIPLKLNKKVNNFNRIEAALHDCRSLAEDAIDKLETSISSMEEAAAAAGEKGKMMMMLSSPSKISDIKTWLSAALTDQDTCLDSLDDMIMADDSSNYNLPEEVKTAMKNSREYTSNSLAIVTNIHTILRDLHLIPHRKLFAVLVDS